MNTLQGNILLTHMCMVMYILDLHGYNSVQTLSLFI